MQFIDCSKIITEIDVMKDQIILYNYFRSSTSYRVRIALNLKKLNFEYKPVHLLNDGGEQYRTEFAELNPQKEVPTLIHNGLVLSQSLPIIEYIDEVFPGKKLFPQKAYSRAVVRQICENINSFLHPVNNLKILQYLENKHGYQQADKEAWIQHWSKHGLQATEELVRRFGGQFAFGDELTAADIFITAHLFSAERFKVDLTNYQRLMNISEKCLKMPEFYLAHPYRQVDTPIDLRLPIPTV